jgi:hypothetical protein
VRPLDVVVIVEFFDNAIQVERRRWRVHPRPRATRDRILLRERG